MDICSVWPTALQDSVQPFLFLTIFRGSLTSYLPSLLWSGVNATVTICVSPGFKTPEVGFSTKFSQAGGTFLGLESFQLQGTSLGL